MKRTQVERMNAEAKQIEALKAALREALDIAEDADMTRQEGQRLSQIRKQFLDI